MSPYGSEKLFPSFLSECCFFDDEMLVKKYSGGLEQCLNVIKHVGAGSIKITHIKGVCCVSGKIYVSTI